MNKKIYTHDDVWHTSSESASSQEVGVCLEISGDEIENTYWPSNKDLKSLGVFRSS